MWKRSLRLSEEEIRLHKHLMGLTGQGKSKLLAQIASSQIVSGIPTAIVDPHSDLCSDVLSLLLAQGYFEKQGYEKLLYIDFSKTDRYLPFNVLKQPYDMHTVARNIVEVCMRAWSSLADGNAVLFENIMLASIPVLIENNLPLTALDNLLTNKPYREQLLANVTDSKVVSFFHERFDRWGKEMPMMISSTLNRAFLLSITPALRYSLGQQENVLDFRRIMDEGISVIFNLGGLDQQTQKILGCIISVGFEQAAMSRTNIPYEQRSPYQLILDEFHMFSSATAESLSNMLSLVRKFGLTLTLSNQSFSQTTKRLQAAMGNCLPIYFKLDYEDAKWSAPRIGNFDPLQIKEASATERELANFAHYTEQYETWTRNLHNLEKRHFYFKGVKAKSIDVNIPKNVRLDHLKQYYAHTLLTPVEQIKEKQEPEIKISVSRKRRL